jgi:hypothetical protein
MNDHISPRKGPSSYLYRSQTSLVYGTLLAWIGSTAMAASLAEMASMSVVTYLPDRSF